MSKSLFARSVAVLMLSAGAALAQSPAPATPASPAQAPKVMAPAAPAQPAAPAVAQPKAAAPAAQTAVINLNTASEAELQKLDKIGPARAKDIVEARTKAKFKNWADFESRNVVPKDAEAAIKTHVTF